MIYRMKNILNTCIVMIVMMTSMPAAARQVTGMDIIGTDCEDEKEQATSPYKSSAAKDPVSPLYGTYHFISPDVKYGKLGSLAMMDIMIFPGYSTSIFKANVYQTRQMAKDTDLEYLFGGTCLFLNGEYRLGMSLTNFADASIMFGYSYTPEMGSILEKVFSGTTFNYVDNDTELFFGAELSSRIASMNASLRFGYRINRGDFNIYDSQRNEYSTVAFDASGFIVSVGFRLGGGDTKVLRVNRKRH